METLGDKMETYVDKLTCEFCFKHYKERTGLWRHKNKCSSKSTIINKLATLDDNLATLDDNLATNINNSATKAFTCENCNKEYKHRQGLWKHKQKCDGHQQNITQDKESTEKINSIDKDSLIMMLLKQNSEIIKEQTDIKNLIFKEQADIKEIILEIVKNGTHNTTTTHTNSHNKAFNLQFFLNETCKNAMNITDFVESIKLQLSDFMSIGEVGFVEGISNIIVKNLNSLDETVRPIHCTDQKRETFYVKDENKWEKEEDDRKKLKKMIRGIAYKNEKFMRVYKDTYPDYNNPDSKRSDQYSKIMIEAMDCKEESREKIIRNISKATTIVKA
jgi:hypothetical protein